MIILITGVPGSGKTLWVVQYLDKLSKTGRVIYTDIDGLDDYKKSPDDWRDCDPGSVVVYDECQKRFSSDRAGRARDVLIRDMETHRHLGIDLVLITQNPSLLHSEVRKLVGRHHHFLRIYGLERSKIFTRDCCITDPLSRSQLNQCDQKFWSFPKVYYNKYVSSEAHTHKAYMPSYIRNSLIILFLLVCVFAYVFRDSYRFFSRSVLHSDSNILSVETRPLSDSELNKVQASDIKLSDHKQEPLELLSYIPSPVDHSSLKKLSACLQSFDSCRCYDEDYFLIHQTASQCLKMMSSLPVYVKRSSDLVMLDSNLSTKNRIMDDSKKQ